MTGSLTGAAGAVCAETRVPQPAISIVTMANAALFMWIPLHDSEQDFGANEIDEVVEPNVTECTLAAVDFGSSARANFGFGYGRSEFLLIKPDADQNRVSLFAADFGAPFDLFNLTGELF